MLDRIGYLDPNVVCGGTPIVQWVYGRFTLGTGMDVRKVYGWIPTRPGAPVGPARQC